MDRIDRIMNKLKMKDADYKVGVGFLLYERETGLFNLDTLISNGNKTDKKEIPVETFDNVQEGINKFIEYCHFYGTMDPCNLLIDDGKEVYMYEPEEDEFTKAPRYSKGAFKDI